MALSTTLKKWAEAGERPHEVLDEGELQELINELEKNTLEESELRRFCGSDRFQVDEEIRLDIPTSWCNGGGYGNFEVLNYMAEGVDSPTFLRIIDQVPKGVFNCENSFGENECILAPIKLKVVKIDEGLVDVEIVE